MLRRAIILLTLTGLPAAIAAQPQPPLTPDLGRLGDPAMAETFNRALAVGAEDGRSVARLDERQGDGGVLLRGVQLADGVIEVELKGKDVLQQSFLGIAFHVVDWTELDAVYFRPFNFRSPDPERRAHAVQYVAHPAYTWQRLRAERTGQFEKTVDPPPDPNGWFRARIVLAGGRVDVFVNGAATPSLSVDDLGAAKSGGVALWVGNGSGGAFRGLTVTPTTAAGPAPASRQNIFQASSTGNLARVRALVDANPGSVRERNPGGLTPLHAAAMYGQRAVAGFLLEQGADPSANTRHSGRPLDLAAENGHTAFVAWLESSGGRFTPLTFDTRELAPGVRRAAFPWGMMNNVVMLAGEGAAVIVDSGFSTRAIPALRDLATDGGKVPVRFVINTHAHGDHVTGNALAPDPAAVISSATLAAPPPDLPLARDAAPLVGRTGRSLPAGYTLKAAGLDIRLIPRPGLHSDADLLVYVPRARVVAMGDLLLSECVPAAPNVDAYLSFLDDVLDVFPDGTTFVSGHGKELDAAGVRAYRETLREMTDLVRKGLAAGRTADQLAADDILKAYKPQFSLLQFLPVDTLIRNVSTAAPGAPR